MIEIARIDDIAEEVYCKLSDYSRVRIDVKLIQAGYHLNRDYAEVVRAIVRRRLSLEGRQVE